MLLKFVTPYLKGVFGYLLLLFVAVYVWKQTGILWIEGFSSHLSNFALTGVGSLLLIGPRSFGQKEAKYKVLAVTLFFIAANLTVELLVAGSLGGFNVPDGFDAFFGTVASGIIVAFHGYGKWRAHE
jgi:hypothetical protein